MSGRYAISATTGGQSIEMLLPPCYRDRDRMLRMVSGFVSYQDSFWTPDLARAEAASDELKSAYRAIRATLKRHLVHYKTLGLGCWLTPTAVRLLEQKTAAILVSEGWMTLDLDKKIIVQGPPGEEE